MAAPEPPNPILHNNANMGPDSDQVGHLMAGAPDSGGYRPDDSQTEQDLDIESSVMLLATAEPSLSSRPGPIPAALLPRETILKILEMVDLKVQDFLRLERANIGANWSLCAREATLRKLKVSDILLSTTVYRDHREELTKTERLSPVIRNRRPGKWVLPDNRIVFEPDYDLPRPRYHRNHYRPTDLEMVGLPGHPEPVKWRLVPHHRLSHRDENSRGRVYLPHTNCRRLREDKFSVFDYYHERDLRKEFCTKVWYKFDGDQMQLHCISIPLQLLVVILLDDF